MSDILRDLRTTCDDERSIVRGLYSWLAGEGWSGSLERTEDTEQRREREREPQWGRVVVGGRGLAVHPNINIYQPTRRFSLLIQSNLHLTSSYLS